MTRIVLKSTFLLSLIFLLGGKLFAQQITGVVNDENNNPLPGVNVVIEGTTFGTITNVDGKFSLQAQKGDVLIFSFIGYNTEKLPLNGETNLTMNLLPDLKNLEEVVVIGYGTVKKRDLTGSVASVSAKQLKDIPVISTESALTGRLAGVQITTSEGSPDAQAKIRIRGGGSITQDNSPLYIVDGLPVNSISDVAPSDIASIDVLKDASSTAIYGARGANGVLIITTKKGKKGKMEINYDFYYGVKKLAKKLDVLDPYQYVLYQYERTRSNYQDRTSFETNYGTWDSIPINYQGLAGTDWQNEVFGQTASTKYNNLSLRGGSEKSTYSLSLSRNDDQGIMLNSGFVRNTLNFRFENKATDKLKLTFDTRMADVDVDGAGTSDPGTSSSNTLRHSVMYRPTSGLNEFISDPTLSSNDDYASTNLTNPVDLINDDYKNKKRTDVSFNGGLTYKIFDALSFESQLGLNLRNQRTNRFYGPTTSTARRYGEQPVADINQTNNSSLRWVNTLNFSKTKIADKHDINILIGQEMINGLNKVFEEESRYFPKSTPPLIAIGSMGLGEEPQKPYTYESQDRLLSFFGRVNYGLSDKYLASFTLRGDGSTKFGKDNRWGVFPSGSLAWRISKEDFMRSVPVISSMKARVSYGTAGNNRIDDYLFSTVYSVGTSKPYFINESPYTYLYPDALANPELKWETTVTRNAGLDLGILDDRLTLTTDVYSNKGKDLLLQTAIDPSSGYSYQMQNIGKTTNYGIEFVLDAYIIEKQDFTLSANFNISFNKNRVDYLGGPDEMLWGSGWNNDVGYDYLVKVGQPVGEMYGFVTDGFYKVDDFNYDAPTQTYTIKDGVANNEGIVFAGFGPGSVKFKNLADPVDENGNPVPDGNQVTFADDRTVIGHAIPKHTGGLNLMANYKGIDLSIFMNWVYGNDIYNANKIEFTSAYYPYNNLLTDMNTDHRWMTVNSAGEVVTDPVELAELNKNATIWTPQTGRYLFHSWAVEDGSFLRINNITLGYNLPKSLLSHVRLSGLRVYATVNNVFTFTNYSGYDPEVDTRHKTPLTPGVDYSAYPRSRSVLFGINVKI